MDSFDPPDERGGEADPGEEIAGGLVVAGGDCPPVFETAERAFDQVALPVGDDVEGRDGAAVRHRRDHRPRALPDEKRPEIVGVVGPCRRSGLRAPGSRRAGCVRR